MGGPACWIIINCGALKSAALGLASMYQDGNAFMRGTAVELGELDGEICDLGPEIAPLLSPEDRAEIIKRGDAANALCLEIDAYMEAHARSGLRPVTNEMTAFRTKLRAFLKDQRVYFRGLASKYKDQP